uniref:Uncharacterized protein n=1 Tax=Amphimedon queenslandica TaxID=400682 RepID=A0A1X7TD68_AMPQE
MKFKIKKFSQVLCLRILPRLKIRSDVSSVDSRKNKSVGVAL